MRGEESTVPPGDEGLSRPAELPRQIIRFATFELRTVTRELYKQGTRIRLQIKPFQVLETLLERPGELVTREELRQRLWPSGTFVDFESGLNTAINRLRSALGDSADEPRYIETLPRLGYRFICPVEVVERDTAPAIRETGQNEPPAPAELSQHSAPPSAKVQRTVSAGLLAALAAGLLGLGLLIYLFVRVKFEPSADFRPVNFRGAGLITARFLDSRHVVYSASLEDSLQTYVSSLDGANANAVPIDGVLQAVSKSGNLAVIAHRSSDTDTPGLLRRRSLRGSAAATIAQGVVAADWTADEKQIAAVRVSGSQRLVELPLGRPVYRSEGWINGLRISPDGSKVAFLEHPVHDDDAGHVRVVDQSGATRVLTPEWSSAEGLAWDPTGREVWFTASKGGLNRQLFRVSLSGRLHEVSHGPISLRLLDVSADGRALVASDDHRMTLRTAASGKEADISQFDFSHVDDISRDGSTLLFTESGDAGGLHYAAYVYDLKAHSARRFGPGRALALSPDGEQAITLDPQNWTELTITCLVSGRASRVPQTRFRYQWARFLKPGDLLVGGSFEGQPLIMAREDIRTGKLTPIPGAPYMDQVAVSPDGSKIAGRDGGLTEIFDLNTKSIERLPNSHSVPIVWGDDGRTILLLTSETPPYQIVAYNLDTKDFELWKTIAPQNAAAFAGLAGIAAAPEAGAYAYSAHLKLSRLYLVDGLL